MIPFRRLSCFVITLILSSCLGCRLDSCVSVDLISPPVSLAALKQGDLNEARRILEPRLAATPLDAELSYTLGCVYLVQSDAIPDRATSRSLQKRGWQLVEAASGKYFPADTLLTHAYLQGRWGKKKNRALYHQHSRMANDLYLSQNLAPRWDGMMKRRWLFLTGPDLTIRYN